MKRIIFLALLETIVKKKEWLEFRCYSMCRHPRHNTLANLKEDERVLFRQPYRGAITQAACATCQVKLGDIKIYNSTGQTVYSACNINLNQAEFDVSHLPAGVYHLRVFAKGGEGGAKFVRQ